MADINVTLELDDKNYTSKLKSAETAAASLGSKTSSSFANIKQALDPVNSGIDSLNSKISSLTGAIIGVGLVGFVHSLLEGANQLKDMANAVDVNISRLMEMGFAASKSGSDLESVATMLNKLEQNAYAAAEGDLALRDAFAKVGVTFDDLKNKTPDEIFNQIAVALSKIHSPAEVAALKMQLLGKGARSWDPKDYVESLLKVAGTMDPFGESQKRAADIAEQMAGQFKLVKIQFLELISPLMNLIGPTDDMAQSMSRAKIVAEVFLGIFTAGALGIGIGGTVKGFTAISNGALAVANALGLVAPVAGTAAVGMSVFTATAGAGTVATTFLAGAIGRLGTATAAEATAQAQLSLLQSSGTATATTLAAAETALASAKARVAVATEAMSVTQGHLTLLQEAGTVATAAQTVALGGLGARMAALGPIAVAAAGALALLYHSNAEAATLPEHIVKLNEAIATLPKAQQEAYFKMLNDKTVDANTRKQLEQQLILQSEAKKTADAMAKITGENKTGTGTGMLAGQKEKDVTLAAKEQLASINAQTESLNYQNKRMLERIALEGELATASRATREGALAGFDAQTKRQQEMFRIDQEISKVRAQIAANPTEAAQKGLPGLIAGYEKQKQVLTDIAAQAQSVKESQIKAADAAELSLYYSEQERKARGAIADLNVQIADVGKSEEQRRLAGVERLIQKEIELAVAKEQSQMAVGSTVTEERRLEIVKKITDAYTPLVEKQRELTRAQAEANLQLFKTKAGIDIQNELNKLQDESAMMLLPEIEKKYLAIEIASRNAANAAIEAEQARRGAGDPMSESEKQAYRDAAAAGNDKLKRQTEDLYNKSRTFSTGWKRAMNDYADSAGNAASRAENLFKKATSGMEDAIVNFAKTGKFEWKGFVDSIVEELLRSQVKSLIADAFGGLGGIMGGAKGGGGGGSGGGNLLGSIFDFGKSLLGFADGGLVGGGRPIMVGERGPEMFLPTSNGTIVPNSALGGGQQVTYNINAVDAASFKSMLAADPSFLHAVAMQGAKNTPISRR